MLLYFFLKIMIQKIIIKDPKDTPVEYADKVFAPGRTFEFRDGVNIIVGPNGSGKSALLNLMRRYLVIPEGVDHVCTSKWQYDGFVDDNWSKGRIHGGAVLNADYKSNAFFMPEPHVCFEHSLSGGASLAYWKETSGKSCGQTTSALLDHLCERMKTLPKTVDYFKDSDGCTGNYWNGGMARAYRHYVEANSIPYNGTCTVMLDEPDKNLDVFKVKELSETLLSMPHMGLQVIAVIHNPLLIVKLHSCYGVYFIEMTPGYASSVVEEVKNIAK